MVTWAAPQPPIGGWRWLTTTVQSASVTSYLNELKLAMRALCRTAQFILPWNMSFNAIDSFLHSSNYANAVRLTVVPTDCRSSRISSTTSWVWMLPHGWFLDFWWDKEHLDWVARIPPSFSACCGSFQIGRSGPVIWHWRRPGCGCRRFCFQSALR